MNPMRIHSDTLTHADIHAATRAAGMTGVDADVMTHASRTRVFGHEVHLTGTSSRRPNTGNGGAGRDDYAATWDEWGMFLAALFEIDPRAVVGSVKRPTYAGGEHFHARTCGRFESLTAPYQHGRGGHRWEYAGGRHDCTGCEAAFYFHDDTAPYLARIA